jgi:hypothetical protein
MFPGPRLQGEEFVVPLSGMVDAIFATIDGVRGATGIGLGTSVLVFVGLVLLAAFGDHRTPWPWIALGLAAYQTLLQDAYWFKTINSLRFTVAGAAVLLVVLGERLARSRAPAAA